VQQLQCSMVVNRKLAWACLLLGWLCQIIQVNLSMGLPIRKLHGMDHVEALAIFLFLSGAGCQHVLFRLFPPGCLHHMFSNLY
jgi:hypothetical protein